MLSAVSAGGGPSAKSSRYIYVGFIIILAGVAMFPLAAWMTKHVTTTGVVLKQYSVMINPQPAYATSVTITPDNDTLYIGTGTSQKKITFPARTYGTLQQWQDAVQAQLSSKGTQIKVDIVGTRATSAPSAPVTFTSTQAANPGTIGTDGTTCWAPLGLRENSPVMFAQRELCKTSNDCENATDVCMQGECQAVGKCNTPDFCTDAVSKAATPLPIVDCTKDNVCTRTDPAPAGAAASAKQWIARAALPVYTPGSGTPTKQKLVQYMYGLPGTVNALPGTITVDGTNNGITVTQISNPNPNPDLASPPSTPAAQAFAMTIQPGTYTPAALQAAVNQQFAQKKLHLTMTRFCAKNSWNAQRQMCQPKAPGPTPGPTPGPSVSTTEGVVSYTPMFVYTGPTTVQKIIIGGSMRAPLGRIPQPPAVIPTGAENLSTSVPGTTAAAKAAAQAKTIIQAAEADTTALVIYTQFENEAFSEAQAKNKDLASVVVPNQVNAPYVSTTASSTNACRVTSTTNLTGLSSLRNQTPSTVACNVFSSAIHPEDPGTKSTWEHAPTPSDAVYQPGDFIPLYFTKGLSAPPSSYNPDAAVPSNEGDSTLIMVGIILIAVGVVWVLGAWYKSRSHADAAPETKTPAESTEADDGEGEPST